MPHIVSCTYDHGEVKREKLMREEVDATLSFLAQRQKKFMRRLRTGQEDLSSPHFNLATGGLDPTLDANNEEEEAHPEEDSVWNTTYKMNFNQNNSASAGNVLHLPPIPGRKKQFHHRSNPFTPSSTYPPRNGAAANGPGKLEFETLKSRLASPKGVNIGTLAQQLYPDRVPLAKSLVQTSRYDFKFMSTPEKAKKEEDEEEVEPAEQNASTIRFLGLTLPGMEVPIMSRMNSKFKMPEF